MSIDIRTQLWGGALKGLIQNKWKPMQNQWAWMKINENRSKSIRNIENQWKRKKINAKINDNQWKSMESMKIYRIHLQSVIVNTRSIIIVISALHIHKATLTIVITEQFLIYKFLTCVSASYCAGPDFGLRALVVWHPVQFHELRAKGCCAILHIWAVLLTTYRLQRKSC